MCKALQDRGTSPGLEGSSDSRSARVRPSGSTKKFAIVLKKVEIVGINGGMYSFEQANSFFH